MRAAPRIPFMSRCSVRKRKLRNVADKGEIAQNNPARSASMYFWATGCNVNPMTEQKSASARTQLQIEAFSGMDGVSIRKAAGRAKRPMNPFCRMPKVRASSFLETRSVVMMAAA